SSAPSRSAFTWRMVRATAGTSCTCPSRMDRPRCRRYRCATTRTPSAPSSSGVWMTRPSTLWVPMSRTSCSAPPDGTVMVPSPARVGGGRGPGVEAPRVQHDGGGGGQVEAGHARLHGNGKDAVGPGPQGVAEATPFGPEREDPAVGNGARGQGFPLRVEGQQGAAAGGQGVGAG